MYINKNDIIPKEVLDMYDSVNFANEEHTIYIVSKWMDGKVKYNYVSVSDGRWLLNKWCVKASNFINKTAIIKTEEGVFKVIAEDGTSTAYYTSSLEHYYYGTFAVKYEDLTSSMKCSLWNLNNFGMCFDTFDAIQNVDKEKLMGKQPEYFWVMKDGRYNFINSKGKLLLDEYCDGYEECDNNEILHVWNYCRYSVYDRHKYVRISNGEVITEGCFRKITKIKHGLSIVENIHGHYNVLGYSQEFIFSSWCNSINVITMDESGRVCFLVSDSQEDEKIRYIYSPSGRRLAQVHRVIGIVNKPLGNLLDVECDGIRFLVDHVTGEYTFV